MRSGKFCITTLITLLATATPTCSIPFFAHPAQAQSQADRKVEAYRLVQEGNRQYTASQVHAAIQSWQQALTLYRQVGDREGEATSLANLGSAYFYLGQYHKAIEFYQEALAIRREIGDRRGQINTLNNLGEAYRNLGQYQKAFELHQQSLAIEQELSESLSNDNNALLQEQANSLNYLGNTYFNLGQYQKAIESYQQSLEVRRKIGKLADNNSYALLRQGEARSLGGLGNAYFKLRQYQKAIEVYQQSLAIAHEIDDRQWAGSSLGSLGNAYHAFGQYQKAIEFYQQWLAVAQEIGDRKGEARSLGNLGSTYDSLNQSHKAMEFYQQWLAIAREIGDKEGEGVVLSHMGNLLAKQNQLELAIIFYKQSINVTETIRREMRGLPKEQQESYTETIAGTYRHLADLLLKRDRVLEAQQVLDLLKVQELEDYLSNVRGSDSTTLGVGDRIPEKQIKQGYEAILNQAIEQGKELALLASIPESNRTEVQKQRAIALRKNQSLLTQQFQEFLTSPEVAALVAQLRQTTGGEGFDLDKYATSLQDNLQRLQQDAVILYPLILNDRLELVLVTPYAPPIRRTVAVKREQLNAAIAQFRSALIEPQQRGSIKPAQTVAQQLYNWLIKPIENDLAQAKTKTIIYAPDGQLRYIPLAALYDGNQWLVQRFSINNITAVSLTEFNTKPQRKLQVFAGAFTSGSYSIQLGGERFTFQGLDYAGVEVENLAKTVPNTTKVLDRQFNQGSVFRMNDYSVVHLATHAAFVAGQPEKSFILFGDGTPATLRDVGSWRLPNVDLIVLSACETGLGDKLGDGKKVLGFGYQMQRTGARAAIASLWKVDDGGTQALMNAFYTALENGNSTKAEALRQAQIALITGDYKALGQQRGLVVQENITRSLPSQVSSHLSHPYYWAPFILIGNGS